jgi:hypothetical protein
MSNDKERMIMVTGEDLAAIKERQGELDVPHLLKMTGVYWTTVTEWRAWRSTHTSEAK